MRALAGLADCLWKLGNKQQAISHYKELLRLNPNDNQGIRYILASCLLEEGLDEDFGKLLKDNKDDGSGYCQSYGRGAQNCGTEAIGYIINGR